MGAIALALASSISVGVVDFIGGVKSRRLTVPVVLSMSETAGFILAGIALLIVAEPLPTAKTFWWSFASGAVIVIGIAAYYRGLTVGAMGVNAPIVASAAIVPVAVGIALGEDLSAPQALGIVLALVGVVATAYEPTSPRGGARVALGAGLAVVAALWIGVFYVAIDFASEDDAGLLWVLFIHRLGRMALFVPLYPYLTHGPLRSEGAGWGGVRARDGAVLVVMAILSLTATLTFAAATTLGLLAIVSVIAALFPITTIGLAYFLLGERVSAIQRLGAVIALVGVAVIAAY